MQTAAESTTASDRLIFLDWARIGAFGLLVLYHVGMYYVSWDWHVKSPFASTALEPWMRLSNPWRMSLLFIVSGVASAALLARPGPVMRQRSKRLLLPLLFGVAVLVPPQTYFEVVQKGGYGGSYIEFLRLYFSAYHGFCRGSACLVLPTWNHLWFLVYLWLYTLLLWALLRAWPQALDRLASVVAHALRCWRLLVLPIVFLALARVALYGRFGSTHALVDDWYNHAIYLPLFVLGAILAKRRELFDRMAEWRWPALAAALAGWALLNVYLDASTPPAAANEALRLVMRCVWAAVQWLALVAVLGFARRHLNRDHRWRAALTDAVFPVYLLHQTLIILGAVALRPLGWAPAVEGPLLVAFTLATSLAVWALARRIAWLRPWFGIARGPTRQPDVAGSLVAAVRG